MKLETALNNVEQLSPKTFSIEQKKKPKKFLKKQKMKKKLNNFIN